MFKTLLAKFRAIPGNYLLRYFYLFELCCVPIPTARISHRQKYVSISDPPSSCVSASNDIHFYCFPVAVRPQNWLYSYCTMLANVKNVVEIWIEMFINKIWYFIGIHIRIKCKVLTAHAEVMGTVRLARGQRVFGVPGSGLVSDSDSFRWATLKFCCGCRVPRIWDTKTEFCFSVFCFWHFVKQMSE